MHLHWSYCYSSCFTVVPQRTVFVIGSLGFIWVCGPKTPRNWNLFHRLHLLKFSSGTKWSSRRRTREERHILERYQTLETPTISYEIKKYITKGKGKQHCVNTFYILYVYIIYELEKTLGPQPVSLLCHCERRIHYMTRTLGKHETSIESLHSQKQTIRTGRRPRFYEWQNL